MKTSDITIFQNALQLHEAGKLDEAFNLYEASIEKGESSTESWNYIGMIHYQKGDFNNAVKAWNKALAHNPEYVDAMLNCGVAFYGKQQFNEAEQLLGKAYQLAAHRPEVALHLAQVYLALGKTEAVNSLLNTPKHLAYNIPESYLTLAKVAQAQQDWEMVRKWLSSAQQLSPQHPSILIELAELESFEGNIIKADELYREALVNNTNNPMVSMAYGKFCVLHGDATQGVQYLQQGLNQMPQHWEGWLFLGNGLMEMGHLDDAIKTYEHAKSLNPTHIGIQQQLAKAYSRFVPPWHGEMMADLERNDAYQKAIEQVVNKDSIVFEIGTGSGILSLMAARAGAKHVYGCELSPHLANISSVHVEKNGYKDTATIINKKSTSIKPKELEQKPNVVVAEIFDSGLLGEHAIPSFRHAQEHLCTEDCVVIPRAATVKARLIHLPSLASVNPPKEISGFDLSEFSRFIVPREYKPVHLLEYDYTFCSEEVEIMTVDFNHLGKSIPEHLHNTITHHYKVTSDLPVHGVAFWFDLDLAEGIQLLNHPERKNNHWGQAVFFFKKPAELTPGETVELNTYYNDIIIRFDEEIIPN